MRPLRDETHLASPPGLIDFDHGGVAHAERAALWGDEASHKVKEGRFSRPRRPSDDEMGLRFDVDRHCLVHARYPARMEVEWGGGRPIGALATRAWRIEDFKDTTAGFAAFTRFMERSSRSTQGEEYFWGYENDRKGTTD